MIDHNGQAESITPDEIEGAYDIATIHVGHPTNIIMGLIWMCRRVDWRHRLRRHLGRNATNYFKYLMGRYKRAPRGVCMLSLPNPSLLKFINLLHLN